MMVMMMMLLQQVLDHHLQLHPFLLFHLSEQQASIFAHVSNVYDPQSSVPVYHLTIQYAGNCFVSARFFSSHSHKIGT